MVATKPKNDSSAVTETADGAEKRRPLHTIRVDDCSLSIWSRGQVVQGKPTVFYSATIERSYKDKDGTWKYTKSFDADSLGKVIALCQQAGEYITALQQEEPGK